MLQNIFSLSGAQTSRENIADSDLVESSGFISYIQRSRRELMSHFS